ncbi:MAG: hypothetical protein HC896_19020 [Bacteroidales bacterium]|nr:hypothetical protein [Bacteroidales bacterium]
MQDSVLYAAKFFDGDYLYSTGVQFNINSQVNHMSDWSGEVVPEIKPETPVQILCNEDVMPGKAYFVSSSYNSEICVRTYELATKKQQPPLFVGHPYPTKFVKAIFTQNKSIVAISNVQFLGALPRVGFAKVGV